MLEPYTSSDLWMEFDRAFERFRRDFEDLLWPSELPMMREMETNMPAVDLEDKGDKYVMSAEVPGFKNDAWMQPPRPRSATRLRMGWQLRQPGE